MTSGILAIWNDCAPGHEAAYEAWYMKEHLPERLSLPGFRRGRRYTVVGPGPVFFTYYETDSPGVLEMAEYLARVEDPTPLTRQMMSSVFLNMNRTVCRVAARIGEPRGGVATVLRMDQAPSDAHLTATITELVDQPGVVRAEAWVAAQSAPLQSEEARLRGGDAQIGACIMVETLRESDAWRVQADLAARHAGLSGVYRLLCELTR